MNTTPSGLQYEDTVEGDGPIAQAGQDVTVHYTGWLWVDGARTSSSSAPAWSSRAGTRACKA